MDSATNSWNLPRLQEYVDRGDIPLVLSLRPTTSPTNDGYCWHYTNSGLYTVRLGYEVARRKLDEETQFLLQQPSCNSLKEHVWKVATISKILPFLW